MTHYPLTSEEWLSATSCLRYSEVRILFYLRTLDPFGDRELELVLVDLAHALNIHKGTVSKALRRLADLGWFEYFEIQTVRLKLASCPPKLPTGREGCLQASEVAYRQPEKPVGNFAKIEPSPEEGSSDRENTNNCLTLLDSNKNSGESTQNDQSGIGTLFAAIETIGVKINKTIQGEVRKILQDVGFKSALKRVQFAIEAVKEQIDRGNVKKSLGGLLVVALRKGFTPNNDGYKRRSPSPPSPGETALPPAVSPPAVSPPAVSPPLEIPDRIGFEKTCDQLLIQGQRAIVLQRLQQLIDEGYRADVQTLLLTRRDWQIRLKNGLTLLDLS